MAANVTSRSRAALSMAAAELEPPLASFPFAGSRLRGRLCAGLAGEKLTPSLRLSPRAAGRFMGSTRVLVTLIKIIDL